ncbi:glycosyl transferase [Litchfieldella qijiaojingensis]|uniref:Glycosyl transferase n=1 Tax=Litchfieldella qijiaojingensis TaxID=980347 RepID=A0ABQ2Z997_9GAMM|nr:glycosyltransferase [Halomonas qijiaojingensis]GGY06657.1 glycosyl transferase [Halomonas qijiaojingensis]
MKKIAILLPDLRSGGVERVRILLAKEFSKNDYIVEFVLLKAKGELLKEALSDFVVVELGVNRIRELVFALPRYLIKNKPDILLVGMWPLTGIACILTTIFSKKTKLIVSEHVNLELSPTFTRIEKKFLAQFGRFIYAKANSVIAVSEGVADSISTLTGLSRERIKVIYNPVRNDSFIVNNDGFVDPGQAWWNGSNYKIIAVGSLKKQKGFEVLISAMKVVILSLDAKLIILGEGELRGDLEAQIDSLELKNNICLLGYKESPYDYLNKANLFVLSSHWEGLGNVITEALTAGVPVVATNCKSGPSEILCGGRYGKLVPVGDSLSMANAIIESLKSVHDTAALKMRARAFEPSYAAEEYMREFKWKNSR